MDKADKNILTADEINFMLQDESKYKSIPTIKLFGISVGLESLIITIISIIVWIIIWKIFGLFKLGKFTIILFILYIIIAFFNIFNSSTDTEISVENAVYELQNQISRIEGALGSIVLVFVFLYNILLFFYVNLQLIYYLIFCYKNYMLLNLNNSFITSIFVFKLKDY
jgi:uncharacterized membrane protein YqjE